MATPSVPPMTAFWFIAFSAISYAITTMPTLAAISSRPSPVPTASATPPTPMGRRAMTACITGLSGWCPRGGETTLHWLGRSGGSAPTVGVVDVTGRVAAVGFGGPTWKAAFCATAFIALISLISVRASHPRRPAPMAAKTFSCLLFMSVAAPTPASALRLRALTPIAADRREPGG